MHVDLNLKKSTTKDVINNIINRLKNAHLLLYISQPHLCCVFRNHYYDKDKMSDLQEYSKRPVH